jgi:hypothetical protein
LDIGARISWICVAEEVEVHKLANHVVQRLLNKIWVANVLAVRLRKGVEEKMSRADCERYRKLFESRKTRKITVLQTHPDLCHVC